MPEAEALWITQIQEARLLQEHLPTVSTDQIEIESLYSAISLGTEKLVFNGQVPPSLYTLMRVPYQKGDFDLPIKYGYSLVGKVVNAKNHNLVNEFVHLLHPHQDNVVVNMRDVTVIPSGINPKDAPHLSNMETALNAVWDSQVTIGDNVLVVGFGTIGSLVALILQTLGYVNTYITDIDEHKMRVARNLGLKTLSTKEAYELSGDFDVSIHCSGSNVGLQTAIDVIGVESKCVDVSWYGTNKVELSLGETFHPMRKQIISSQVSTIPISKQHRWDHSRRKKLLLQMLKDKLISPLTSQTIPFYDIPETYESVLNGETSEFQTLIKY